MLTFAFGPEVSDVEVMVLCGGMGTRLREETEFRPKPMIEIGGRPILWHIMKNFAHFGMREFLLCLGYKANAIKDYFLSYEAHNNDFTVSLGPNQRVYYHNSHQEQDFTVTLTDTGLTAMTGARVARASKYLKGPRFMVTYGDGLADVDIPSLVKFHESHGKLATVTTVKPVSRFGVIDFDSTGRVNAFAEKPTMDMWVSAGFFVFERGVLDFLSTDDSCVLERDPLERLAGAGQLFSYQHPGCFFAMDTYRDFQMLNDMWSAGRALWKLWP
jgi:glucose-1-phosphate cytidylyltransferase